MKNWELKKETYDAPRIEIVDFVTEGVLCGSIELDASHGSMSTGYEYNFTVTDSDVWN